MECAFQPVVNHDTVREGLENVFTDLTYMKYEPTREKEIIELTCQGTFLTLSKLINIFDFSWLPK